MEYPFKDLLPLDEVLAREGYYKDWTHLDPEVFYSLTQISNFIKTKGYGVDVRLLIAQLAEHFGLKTTQVVDLANLLQQKFTNLEGVTQSFTSNINSLVAQMEADKDAVIANATVDSEVILARGGKATLGQRLDDTTAQLAQTTQIANQDGYEINSGLALSRTPLVTFVSDDIHISDYSPEVKSIFINHGVPCVLAAIPGRIEDNDPNTMTYAQLREMQDNHGYEIASHSMTHQYMTTLTESQIDYEFKESHRLLNANGLNVKNFCVPYGDYNGTVKKIGQKYYRGIRVSGHKTNPYPIDNLNIDAMSTEFNDEFEFENLDACKYQVDKALANNEWLVFLFHAWNQTPESLANLDELITYIKSKSIDIVTMDKALDTYATAVQSGTNAGFRLGKDGVIYSKQGAIYYQNQDAVSSTTPIGDYFPNHLNICPIIGEKANFPEGSAGTLLTYNFKSDEAGFQWQEFVTYNFQSKYTRRVTTTGNWTSWEQINYRRDEQITLTKGRNEYNGSTLPSAFPVGKIINTSVAANSAGMPTTIAGLFVINTTALTTSGASDYGMVTQEYTKYGTNEKWIRTAIDATSWKAWQKVTVV